MGLCISKLHDGEKKDDLVDNQVRLDGWTAPLARTVDLKTFQKQTPKAAARSELDPVV